MNKKDLTETDIRTKFITPAIEAAGWDKVTQMREEYYFTAGRIIVRGKLVARGEGKKADYLLYASGKISIAVVEAKDNKHEVAGGIQQALGYVEALDIPFVFSSNGDAFAFHDRTGTFPTVESELPLDQFPSPELLQAKYDEWNVLSPAQEAIPPMQGYIKLHLEKQYGEMRLQSAGGAQPNLNAQKIKKVFVSLPLLAEQSRIVTKVDQLMVLVDQLETRFTDSRAAAQNLLKALVSELATI